MASILMLLSKPFVGDPRVTRETISLSDSGHKISILSWNREGIAEKRFRTEYGTEIFMIGPSCSKREFGDFLFKLPQFWLSCLLSQRRLNFSLVHAHDFDTLPIGLLIGRLRGCKVLYDAHEPYAAMTSGDVPSIVARLITRLEKIFVKLADAVVVAAKGIALLINRLDAVEVLNCPSRSELPKGKASTADHKGAGLFKLGYFGSMEPGRFLAEAVEIISENPNMRMIMGGEGTLSELMEEMSRKSKSIEFLGRLSHAEVMDRSTTCNAMLVVLDPQRANYMISTPLRLFEATSLGIPPIVTRNSTSAELVLSWDFGYVSDYDKESFFRVLEHIASNTVESNEKGRRGRQAFDKEFNWEKQVQKLLSLYSDLIPID